MAPRHTAPNHDAMQRALLSRQRRQQRLDEFLVCLRCGGEAQLLGGTPGIGKLHGEVVAHDGLEAKRGGMNRDKALVVQPQDVS